jgi:hypothetical protein
MNRARIVFVPVDERFCTRDYFLLLAEGAGLQVVTPALAELGQKKTSPDLERLGRSVLASIGDGDTVIASVDMLVHGGLIPSRISLESLDTVEDRLSIFPAMRRKADRVYASVCVTRTPFYNSSEEEPDYWAFFGARLWALSREIARFRRRLIGHEALTRAARGIPEWMVEDFLARRMRNFRLVSRTLDLVAQGEIDFLNLTLDDNTEGSLSLWESEQHARKAGRLGIQAKVSIHPGADESTLTLLARCLCDAARQKPRIRVEYSAPSMRHFIPPFEGSPHDQSIRSHLEAAGCSVTESDGEDALLFVHNPTDKLDAGRQKAARAPRSLYRRAVHRIEGYRGITGIAGTRYVNGSDNRFVAALFACPLDWSRLTYAGWNTAGNTLGTTIAFLVVRLLHAKNLISGSTEKLARLQTIFLLEHWAYMTLVRGRLLRKARRRGCNGWNLMPAEQWAIGYVEQELSRRLPRICATTGFACGGLRVSFPWHRAFEVRIEPTETPPQSG